ncbi:uncharacterized protein LOC134010031 [Osmerus eperlanus]|uniref:uncharacterized protein LOC134010031 n=1 Tax=Osmerus eperlanus TaxID=29151 RepID=UPI002E0EFC00
MSLWVWLKILGFLSVSLCGKAQDNQNVTFQMECRERYFLISTDLSLSGTETRFEAVDDKGVHPITKEYGFTCGYIFSIMVEHFEFRASYFSCHTDNQKDEAFTFHFNLITTNGDGEEIFHTVIETCYPSIPWSSREVTCEEDYVEVILRRDVFCPSYTTADNWDRMVQDLATSGWQVMFNREGVQPTTMSISMARSLGYLFDALPERLLFRSPFGQPHAFISLVNGVFLEVIHPTLYSRQKWLVVMVDLVAACSTDRGHYEGSRMVWETPTLLPPLVLDPSKFAVQSISMGVNGQLQFHNTTQGDYTMEINNATVLIGIPFHSAGYRKSFVMEKTYNELYVVHLYYEQVFVTEEGVETRLRQHRPMVTPLLTWHPFTMNQTDVEERVFIVYFGNLPSDVTLVAVNLNGQDFTVPLTQESSFSIARGSLPNGTHAYVLRVPFEDSLSKLYLEEGLLQFMLDINFTLTIMDQEEPFYHLASVVAELTDVFPPSIDGFCSENGISFQWNHEPVDDLWEVAIGPDPLTPELAAQRGYVVTNNSQSIILDVPLFTIGYSYENITLSQFVGSLEIQSRNLKTPEIQQSVTMQCHFDTTELIVCSTHGVMTVVTEVLNGADPSRTSLLQKTCTPKEMNNSRVLFEFGLNSCGTLVQVDYQNVIYENEIIIEQSTEAPVIKKATLRGVVRCVYPLAGLSKLFTEWRFESEAPGQGTVVYTTDPRSFYPVTTIKPIEQCSQTTTPPSTMATPPRIGASIGALPAGHPSASYVRVLQWQGQVFTEAL